MVRDRHRKGDLLLIVSGAFLINLLILALIPWLFRGGGVKKELPARIGPPVFLVPDPVEKAPSEKLSRFEREPETRLPEPVPPAPLPLPELNPKIKLSPVKITPRIKTDLKLDHLPAPSAVPVKAAVTPDRGFYRVGELDSRPLGMARIQPPYPFLARRRGIEGRVKIRFFINESGAVEGLKIIRAEPPGYFEKTVRQTVPRWRFKPGMIGGRAVKTLVETTIVFKLDH